MNIRNRWSSGLIFMVLFLAACGTSRPLVPVSASLEASSLPMKVERRRTPFVKDPMRFGSWQVTAFTQEGFPTRRKTSVGGPRLAYSNAKGLAAYRFVMMSGAAEPWECHCKHVSRERGVEVGPDENRFGIDLQFSESLQCDLRRDGSDAVWKLHVHGSLAIDGEGYEGTLSDGSRSLSLRASHEIANLGHLPGPPTGYLFVRDDQEIASTELLFPGTVRIGDAAGADREVIATAAAALLLQPATY